jgi:hypothetical protein
MEKSMGHLRTQVMVQSCNTLQHWPLNMSIHWKPRQGCEERFTGTRAVHVVASIFQQDAFIARKFKNDSTAMPLLHA